RRCTNINNWFLFHSVSLKYSPIPISLSPPPSLSDHPKRRCLLPLSLLLSQLNAFGTPPPSLCSRTLPRTPIETTKPPSRYPQPQPQRPKPPSRYPYRGQYPDQSHHGLLFQNRSHHLQIGPTSQHPRMRARIQLYSSSKS
ncbi:hypothetical protein CFOL_v3_22437, partial [Cephalotus follicularis]